MTKTTKRLQHQLRKRKRKRRRRRKKCYVDVPVTRSTQLAIVRCSLDISFKSIELLNFLLVCSSNDDFNRSFDVDSFQFSFCFYVNRFERKRKRFFYFKIFFFFVDRRACFRIGRIRRPIRSTRPSRF